jgi:hypothetical protein
MVLTDRERIMLRTLILGRQMGNASGTISFLLRTEESETIKYNALLDQLKCDLGDLILQAEMLLRDLGLNVIEVKGLAYKRYEECKNEFQQHGKSQFFI